MLKDLKNINIRKATVNDIPSICNLVQQLSPGFSHDYRNAKEKFKSHIEPSPDYYLWVAEADGEILGTAMMHLQHKLSYHCGTAAHLEDVVVDVSARGLGIGKKLVESAVAVAKEHDCYKIMLTCFEKTIPYYEQLGFSVHDTGMRMELKELWSQK